MKSRDSLFNYLKLSVFVKLLRLSREKFFKNKYFRGVLLVLLLLLFIFFAKSKYVLVHGYSCKTQYGPTCDKKDAEIVEKFIDANFFTLNVQNVRSDLMSNFVNEQVSVHKIIPGKLNVIIIKRKPIVGAKIANRDTQGYFLIDREGFVVSFVTNTALGVLNYKQEEHSLFVGGRADEKLKKAAQLLHSSLKYQGALEATLEKDTLKVMLPDGIGVNYPLDKDIAELAGALQLILTRSRVDSKLPVLIDLRYKNPILTY